MLLHRFFPRRPRRPKPVRRPDTAWRDSLRGTLYHRLIDDL